MEPHVARALRHDLPEHYYGTVRAEFRESYEYAINLLRRVPNFADEKIAEMSGVGSQQVQRLRLAMAGAVPNTTHRKLIWFLAMLADDYGLHSHSEPSISLGGRKRLVPDLVVCADYRGPVLWVVEIKSTLTMGGSLDAALKQVRRYHEEIGEGTPVVCAYRVPAVDDVEGVKVWSVGRLRQEIVTTSKALGREARY